MPYKPLIKDQTPEKKEEDPKPNPEADLAVERTKREALETILAEKGKQWDQMQEQLEELRRNRNNPEPQQQQVDAQTQQALINLGISEEEYASNPTQYIQRIQDYMNAMLQAGYQKDQYWNSVATGLSERTHKAEMAALATKDFYKYAKSDIERYYEEHPDHKIPGMGPSPEEVYERMVGKNWEKYYSKRQEDNPTQVEETTPTVVPVEKRTPQGEVPVRPTAPTGPSIHKKEKEIHLSDAEMEIMNHYNKLDRSLKMTPAEWKAISTGRVLPKQASGASDWQRGVPEGAHVTVDD